MSATDGPRFPIGFAHRGGAGAWRANTISAFEAALAAGVSGLESDVWLTSDGVAVLDHDGRVGRRWLPRRAIRTLRFADLPPWLPSLAALFETCGTDFELSLDVLDPAAGPAVVRAAAEVGAAHRIWLVGGRRSPAEWKALDGRVHAVSGVARGALRRDAPAEFARRAAAGLDAVNLPFRAWTPARVAGVHGAGMRAFGWDAHRRERIDALLAMGCDGVYSDDVAALLGALGARAR